ncbi:DUF2511 domain-containing protein [Chamaesiphon sp.]|uniref:DUF2511 domain-containing protein n=1 Tax=Chamaesiphon sp. TaxID=2814140 RepID=UPI0035935376
MNYPVRKKIVRFFGLVYFSFAISSCGEIATPANRKEIDSAMFKEKWMLTVNRGTITCEPPSALVFIAPDGTKYGINGTADTMGYADIRSIWIDDPNPEFKKIGTKMSIAPLMNEARKLCK